MPVALFIVSIVAVAVGALYLYLNNIIFYWKRRNIPTLSPSLLYGNFADVIKGRTSIGECFEVNHHQLGDVPLGGVYLFWQPILLIKDPDIIKNVLIKDAQNFIGRGMYYDEKRHPLSGHLIALSGAKWRRMRVKLTPTFTSGKLKMMFETLSDCSSQLQNYLDETVKSVDQVDIKELLARFSTDVIASVAFGIQCNSIQNPEHEFRVMGRKIFEPTLMMSIRNMSYFFAHSIARIFNLAPTDPGVVRFLTNVIYDTVRYREINKIFRPDFLNILIEMKNSQPTAIGDPSEKDTRGITMDEIAAQAFVFFVAGFETTSSTAGFCLYELARQPDIQQQVRAEIDAALKRTGGKITYEVLAQGLSFTDQVVNETLRLYPAIPVLTREATSDVQISRGASEPPLVIRRGQQVSISVRGLHMDPKYFPDPQRFDPDRFCPENVASRPSTVFLPFGEGPRNCIGMRFGFIQVKLILATLLSRYKVQFCSRTLNPMRFAPNSFVTFPDGVLWLQLLPRDDLGSTAA